MFDGLRSSSARSIGPALWGSDQYYWFTAVLAARGMQTATCRLVAVCIAALGLIPVGLLASPTGPQGTVGRTAAVVIAVACFGLATVWLRDHWPTRAQSLLCVLVGSVGIAVSALIQTNPVVGLTGAASYAVLTAFVVCFHTQRLLALVWTVAVFALGVLIVRLAATDLALAICAAGMIILLNVFVAFACRAMILLIQPDTHHGDIEQLTGLLHRDAFYQSVATLLASRSRSADKYLVVVAVNIDSFSLLLGLSGPSGGNRARVTVGQALRETVRHNAIVAHVSDDDFLIADSFTTADASPLVERIRGAIAATPQRLTASIGVVCTPLPPLAAEPPDEVLDKLIAIATQAIEQARMAGGNQVRYVLRPTLDEDPDNDGDDPRPDTGKSA
ncbi:GGDEF domain-containing protein [Mycolicibacterium chubuense]|uniref:Putative diguanylate cyclase YcdT n=1 Tax=Mycolicibacterium chubuense TaxID=1800 RepID=A0A0J6YXP4_MYCCU|nr:GGDEF domain-containing protein [Mycolicibacterium chubuense]KMO77211.1 putative diguanylate cyclase YcdT [Mycolicibacterium chubuense]ORA50887.1 GGDEF domain-containing protein [Mycolicibacterium chubuense]SPY00216.1 diguanylate cyclase (GGDEF) domain-containing protein [Mycolicibacterium chubuense]